MPSAPPVFLLGGGRSEEATMLDDLPLAMTAADMVTVSPNWTRVGMTELMMTFGRISQSLVENAMILGSNMHESAAESLACKIGLKRQFAF